MKIQRGVMRSYGFNDDEIERVEKYCTRKEKFGTFDSSAVPAKFPRGEICLVCGTVADAISEIAPHKIRIVPIVAS